MPSPQKRWRHYAKSFLVAAVLLAYFKKYYILSASMNARVAHPIQATTALDKALPLVPFFIVFYMLGYVFVFLPPFFIRDRRTFNATAVVFAGMLTIAFACFIAFPVEMHKEIAQGSDPFSRLTRFQQTVDTAFNTFPSLHVEMNTFAYLVVVREHPRWRWWLLPPLVLIILSTLLVKQHLLLDVAGGLALAYGGYAVFVRLAGKPAHAQPPYLSPNSST